MRVELAWKDSKLAELEDCKAEQATLKQDHAMRLINEGLLEEERDQWITKAEGLSVELDSTRWAAHRSEELAEDYREQAERQRIRAVLAEERGDQRVVRLEANHTEELERIQSTAVKAYLSSPDFGQLQKEWRLEGCTCCIVDVAKIVKEKPQATAQTVLNDLSDPDWGV